jgi:hypothetical protein
MYLIILIDEIMKVSILKKSPTAATDYMYQLFMLSLQDLGYYTSNIDASDIVIVFTIFPTNMKKDKDKFYIFMQTEQQDAEPDPIKQKEWEITLSKYYWWNPDLVWGFDKNNIRDTYFCLGYHPKLDFSNSSIVSNIDISLLGYKSERRKSFISKLSNSVNFIKNRNQSEKAIICQRSKINLDIRACKPNTFTCWDRLSFLISNKCFIISEYCDFPMKELIRFNSDDNVACDNLIKHYLENQKERIENINCLHEQYKSNFDMRNILENNLKTIKV